MNPEEVAKTRVKEVEDDNKVLKQLLLAKDSSILWHKTPADVRLITEKVTFEFPEFIELQQGCCNRLSDLGDKFFKAGQGNESSILFQKYEINREKNDLVLKRKDNFKDRIYLALLDFKNTEMELSDPNIDQFEFAKKMNPKQRKNFMKNCNTTDEVAKKAMKIFEDLKEQWDSIKECLQDCLDGVEDMYAACHAGANN